MSRGIAQAEKAFGLFISRTTLVVIEGVQTFILLNIVCGYARGVGSLTAGENVDLESDNLFAVSSLLADVKGGKDFSVSQTETMMYCLY